MPLPPHPLRHDSAQNSSLSPSNTSYCLRGRNTWTFIITAMFFNLFHCLSVFWCGSTLTSDGWMKDDTVGWIIFALDVIKRHIGFVCLYEVQAALLSYSVHENFTQRWHSLLKGVGREGRGRGAFSSRCVGARGTQHLRYISGEINAKIDLLKKVHWNNAIDISRAISKRSKQAQRQ